MVVAQALDSRPVHSGIGSSTAPGVHRPGRIWWRWLRRLLVASAALLLLSLSAFALLAFADYTIAGNGSPDPAERARWVWERGDHLHYAVHLVQGRILDVCPCTRRAAAAQYYYARFHAVTPRQRAAVAGGQPNSPSAWVGYFAGPLGVGADWIGDGVAWLSGRRPARAVTVELNAFDISPSETHISRGTRITWRNVDVLGEAHTVTADPGQSERFDSDWLVPDEQFGFTFTERGRYAYFCRAHGAAGLRGMAGVVVVD
jgi:plastocyanin